jgi:hypothetical protein
MSVEMTSAASVSSMNCLFCGEPELVEIHEVWDHEFMFETCCEGLHGIPPAAAAFQYLRISRRLSVFGA